jgi:hypothetical protein
MSNWLVKNTASKTLHALICMAGDFASCNPHKLDGLRMQLGVTKWFSHTLELLAAHINTQTEANPCQWAWPTDIKDNNNGLMDIRCLMGYIHGICTMTSMDHCPTHHVNCSCGTCTNTTSSFDHLYWVSHSICDTVSDNKLKMSMICKTLAKGAKIDLARDNADKPCNWPSCFASCPSTQVITDTVAEKVCKIYGSNHPTTKGGLYASMHALCAQLPSAEASASMVNPNPTQALNIDVPKTIPNPACILVVPKKSCKGKGKALKDAQTGSTEESFQLSRTGPPALVTSSLPPTLTQAVKLVTAAGATLLMDRQSKAYLPGTSTNPKKLQFSASSWGEDMPVNTQNAPTTLTQKIDQMLVTFGKI